jgi:hypothetical protein
VRSAEGGIVGERRRVTEWVELSEEGVRMEFHAAGSETYVDLLRARAEGRLELTVEWREGELRLELVRPGRSRLEVAVLAAERPWFLVRDELVKASMVFDGAELVRRIVEEVYTAAIGP